jgi:hypothetical protein
LFFQKLSEATTTAAKKKSATNSFWFKAAEREKKEIEHAIRSKNAEEGWVKEIKMRRDRSVRALRTNTTALSGGERETTSAVN